MFVLLLAGIINGSNHSKCVSLGNQKYMIQSTLIDLHPNEYNQELNHYPFVVKLDRWVGSCDTLNDLSNLVCIPNKTEGLNLHVFNMITGINESKTLTKHISCECKYKLDVAKCNSNQWWNSNKCWCKCKKHYICEKDYVWNPSTCNCQNRKYLANIIDDSAIVCDEVIDVEARSNDDETVPTNFNEEKEACKTHFYIWLAFINYYNIIDSC